MCLLFHKFRISWLNGILLYSFLDETFMETNIKTVTLINQSCPDSPLLIFRIIEGLNSSKPKKFINNFHSTFKEIRKLEMGESSLGPSLSLYSKCKPFSRVHQSNLISLNGLWLVDVKFSALLTVKAIKTLRFSSLS